MPATERPSASDQRTLHDDKASALKMVDQALCHDPRHDLVRVVDTLAAREP